jgi:dienelactone hydrolase
MYMKSSSLAAVFFVSMAVSAWAQQPRVVDLKATDGVGLKASYFASTKPGPGVLLLHQCNRQRKVWDELATQLAAAGINTLTIDMRGFGESGGTRNDKRTPEEQAQTPEKNRSDIDIAFQYLVSQAAVTREMIGVGGASCGVNNSIQTAIRHPNEVKSLVLLSGGADIAARQFLREDKRIPVLFAVADDDEYAPMVDVVEWLFSTTGTGEKKFIHYQTGGHGADMFKVHPELRNIIVEWFVATLIQTPGKAPASPASAPGLQSATVLRELESPGGIEKVSQQLAGARKGDPKAEIFPEEVVNLMGYDYLQASDTKRALEIMRLNATAYPDSPNACDSLADAYLADGQKDLARENAQKALTLLKTDTVDPEARKKAVRDSAEQKLKQLQP